MTHAPAPDFLFSATHRLFEVLSDGQREEFRRALAILELRRGSRIYAPGDLALHVHWVWSGVVKLGMPAPTGTLLVMSFLFPGDLFGEACTASDEPRDHAAEVHQDATICTVPRELLRATMANTPAFACRMAALLVSRLRASNARIEDLLHRGAHARVAHTLLTLGRPFAVETGHGLVIPLHLTCRDLANLVGVRRETVSLVLADLRQQGIADAQRDCIIVQDPDALAAMCWQAPRPGPAHNRRVPAE